MSQRHSCSTVTTTHKGHSQGYLLFCTSWDFTQGKHFCLRGSAYAVSSPRADKKHSRSATYYAIVHNKAVVVAPPVLFPSRTGSHTWSSNRQMRSPTRRRPPPCSLHRRARSGETSRRCWPRDERSTGQAVVTRAACGSPGSCRLRIRH